MEAEKCLDPEMLHDGTVEPAAIVAPQEDTPLPTPAIRHRYNTRSNKVHAEVLVAATTSNKANQNQKKKTASNTEMRQLIKLKAFEPAHLPGGERALTSLMLFKQKYKANGAKDKMKGRFVALGNHQPDTNIGETYAPTAEQLSFRLALATAAIEGRHIAVIDVTKSAYIQADMDQVVYMRLAPREARQYASIVPSAKAFIEDNGTMVVKLLKALYGLKQSARLWYTEVSSTLKAAGFKPSTIDKCLLIRNSATERTTINLYVDDLLVTSTSKQAGHREAERLAGEQVS